MDSTELEIKFRIDPERLAGVRAAMEAGAADAAPPPRQRLQAHYHDTPDGALAAAGIALRLRKEGRGWKQTLKAPGTSRVHRLEHEVEVAWKGRGMPPLDVGLHDGSDAGKALARALGDGDGAAALAPRYGTDVWRRRLDAEADGARSRSRSTRAGSSAGGDHAPVCEIEFELKSGDAAGLFALAERWREAHGLWLSTLSKAERGELLARGSPAVPAVKAGTPRVDDGMDGEALLRAIVAECLDQIVGNAGEVAAGTSGPEHVHQLRVGIRRLRTVLRELGALSSSVDAAWEEPLVRVFRALGEVRDRKTAAEAVQPKLRAAGAPAVDFPAPEQGGLPDPARVVREGDFQAALLRLLAFTLTRPVAAATAHGKNPRDLTRERLRKLHRTVARDGRRFESLAEEDRHRVRKRLKRLRYLAESVAPLHGEAAVERYLKRLRPAQDALGAHNDAQVALAYYRQAAEREPKAWFAVGWLQARRKADAKACRKALGEVADAPRFWKKR